MGRKLFAAAVDFYFAAGLTDFMAIFEVDKAEASPR